MSERTNEALHSYPTSGLLGSEETTVTSAPPSQQHVTAEDMQQALQGRQPSDRPVSKVLKVNDKEVKLDLTESELDALLQKGLAADEKFREAAEIRKRAEVAEKNWTDIVAAVSDGDIDAFRRAGSAMGFSAAEVEHSIQGIWGDGSEDDEWGDEREYEPERRPSAPPSSRKPTLDDKVSVGDLSPDIQRLMVGLEWDRQQKIVQNYLDKSDIIRYNMDKYDESGQQAIRQLVAEKVNGRLSRSGGDFGDGNHILPDVIKEVEATLKALDSPRRSLSPLGMGPAPGGGDPSVYPTKKPDHISSLDSGFEDNIGQTIMFNLAKARQAQG